MIHVLHKYFKRILFNNKFKWYISLICQREISINLLRKSTKELSHEVMCDSPETENKIGIKKSYIKKKLCI